MTRTTLPKIEPVRPVRSRVVPVGPAWLYELKLDGFRGVLTVDRGRGSFTSKTSKPMPRFQQLADALARSLAVKSAILDGEIVVMTKRGPDFAALFFRRGRPSYGAFDLLWLNGRDLRRQPLWRRKGMLKPLIENTAIGFVEDVDDPALFAVTIECDLEGIVAKRKNDPYGAATQWVKVKHPGYSQMAGRWELFAKRQRQRP